VLPDADIRLPERSRHDQRRGGKKYRSFHSVSLGFHNNRYVRNLYRKALKGSAKERINKGLS
jgi:hypothetical protein